MRSLGPDSARGDIEVRLPTGEVTSRALQGATCREVLRSLSLVAALALDPLASPTPPAAASSPAAPPVPALPPAAPSSAPPAASSAPPGPPPAASAASAAPGTSPREPTPGHALWAVGAHAVVQGAISPDPGRGGGLWVERSASPGSALRLALGASTGGTTEAGPYRASFRAYLAQLSGCWLGAAWGRLTARPCAELQGGWLTAEGAGSDETRGVQRRAWLAPGAGARLGVRVVERVRVEASGALLVPVRRDRFVFEQPRVEAHEVGPVSWQVGLGLGVGLW